MAQLYVSILLPLCLLIGYYVVNKASLYITQSRSARKYGCKPVNKLPQTDLFFGIDLLLTNVKAVKNSCFLNTLKERYDKHGNTFQSHFMGTTTVSTVEPRNIQTILSLNFEDFGLGKLRERSAGPYLGKGIFTSDGKDWKNSRALIQPSFARSQISNLATFKVHVDRLIDLIPKDGTTVDLQELFGRLVSHVENILLNLIIDMVRLRFSIRRRSSSLESQSTRCYPKHREMHKNSSMLSRRRRTALARELDLAG